VTRLRSLRRDRRGATIIEFAIILPVLMMMLMGLFDLMFQFYAQSILTGAVQKAARDSAIEGGADSTAAIDAKVLDRMRALVTVTDHDSQRRSYKSFASIKPEVFYDNNDNNRFDAGDCFDDINANGEWDVDPGATGQGGADDVTVYTFSVSYDRVFPVMKLLGRSQSVTLPAQTLLKNQPYRQQTTFETKRICT
jgi:Flp pilus assembly protein TadG